MAHYLQASKSQIMWGDEGATPYTKASTLNKIFGLIPGDIDFPQANPKSARSTAGGGRRPHTYSQDEYDLKFGLTFNIINGDLPFACAIGAGTATSGAGYTGVKFEDADILKTISVRREQQDAALVEDFVGCKADLTLAAKMGDAVTAQMDFLAASRDPDTAAAAFTTLSIPTTQELRFWMLGGVTMAGGHVGTLATVNGFSCAWKNGLKAYNHGGGRDAYCVAEEESEGRYAMKIDFNPVDNSLYAAALDDDRAVDVVIPIARVGTSVLDMTDGLIICLNDCDILDATLPHKGKGTVPGAMTLAPTSTSVEVRTPTGV